MKNYDSISYKYFDQNEKVPLRVIPIKNNNALIKSPRTKVAWNQCCEYFKICIKNFVIIPAFILSLTQVLYSLSIITVKVNHISVYLL